MLHTALRDGRGRPPECASQHSGGDCGMSGETSHRELALWILGHELRVLGDPGTPEAAAERVCQQLYARLGPLVTVAGSQAFLTRSLRLARDDFPFLEGLRAGPTAHVCLDGMDGALHDVEPELVLDAFVAVIANMIGLLVTFIGEDLAMLTIRDGWPDAGTGRGGGEEMA
jgi:hypothetical protein